MLFHKGWPEKGSRGLKKVRRWSIPGARPACAKALGQERGQHVWRSEESQPVWLEQSGLGKGAGRRGQRNEGPSWTGPLRDFDS